MSGGREPVAGGVRAFVALEIPAGAKARLERELAPLRPRLPGVRFTAPAGWHLTLRFLGDSSPAQLEGVGAALAAATAACPRGTARFTGLGLFPERGAPRVLWLGMELEPRFLALQAACEDAARACGFEPERRPFAPHLTLGRWRSPAPRPSLPELDLGRSETGALVLYHSELHPAGARYTALRTFPLPAERPR